MTVQANDPAVHADGAHPRPTGGATATTAARPRWLVPGLAVGLIVATLVFAGVLSLSTVLYVGLIGGMFAMHLGGHGGHGGHSGNGANGSSGSQGAPGGHGGHGADDQAPADGQANQVRDDGQRPTRGCH